MQEQSYEKPLKPDDLVFFSQEQLKKYLDEKLKKYQEYVLDKEPETVTQYGRQQGKVCIGNASLPALETWA